MGKAEAGTPKAIANRIKAKGLQKLRWFCQMCQKQCRDENGFKCHCMSESHQRQLLLFADNPDKYIDSFSKEFKDSFLALLKRRFGTTRVHANQVYQEYISERLHTHMNATQWETLTEFVKWLGREGICKVDQTEKGWFITYVDRDPDTIEKQKAQEAKEKLSLTDQEREAKFLERQIERELARKGDEPESVYTELQRENEEEKVAFSLSVSTKADDRPGPSGATLPKGGSQPSPLVTAKDKQRDKDKSKEKEKDKESHKRKSALDEIMEMEEKRKEKSNRKDYWLAKGIIVKVLHKKLGDRYYKKKGFVKDVQNRYVGVIKMLDTGDTLKVDQAHLETVIPAVGRPVLIVNGAYRGSTATLVSIDEKSFSVTVELKEGAHKKRVVDRIAYEDICKLDV